MANHPPREADVLVVGGGPAGLATAIQAALVGLRPVVVDRSRPPIDKACGEGLMPDGVGRLRSMGVEVPTEGRAPFRGIRYIDDDATAEGLFPGDPGLGVRRIHLHQAMVERAEEVGVDLRWGVSVTGLADGGVETEDGTLRARWLVAADGLKSRLRRWTGLLAAPAKRKRFGVRRHFAVEPWTDLAEVYWSDGCEAYVTPAGPRTVGVAMVWSGSKGSFDSLVSRFPALQRRLTGAETSSKDRGAGPFEQRCRGVVCGNLALVGDASGYLDPITGEGMALAFHQAFALVEAMVDGDLRRYARAHRGIGRVPLALTRLLVWVEERPRLRRRVMGALAADSGVFSRLLGVHSRELPLRRLGVGTALRLSWLLATRGGRG